MELALATLADKKLYKYRAIDPHHPEYVSRILTHNELYFPSPREFNDPWESKPQFVAGPVHDPQYRQRLVTVITSMMRNDPGIDREAVRRRAEQHTQEEVEALVTAFIPEYWEALERYRVCSFCSSSRIALLWSHYANAHEGFCLEFDASTDIFGGAFRVAYQDEYPSLDIADDDDWALLKASILTKSSDWSYEEEYRLVSAEPGNDELLSVSNKKFVFPPNLLTAVIFGAQMEAKDRKQLIKWADQGETSPTYREATLSATKYELEIRPIEGDVEEEIREEEEQGEKEAITGRQIFWAVVAFLILVYFLSG
jgi:hypothetical protein